MFLLLTEAAQSADQAAQNGVGGLFGGGSIWMTIIYVVVFGAIIYFLMIRPARKEQKKQQAMQASMEIGDVIVTTSGFYGVIIDVSEEDVIVEFGNNKNCRIPMKKSAIAQLEKANQNSEQTK